MGHAIERKRLYGQAREGFWVREARFTVKWPHGIHVRRAAELAAAVKPFAAKVIISANGKRAELRSPLALMALGAVQGTELLIRAEGEEEGSAIAAVLEALAQEKE
jgi:phosphotransferase system HPr (HPr) family protein